MKAVVDDKIPFIKGEIEKLVDIAEYIPGSEISREDLLDAEILVVRTRTKCGKSLLDGTSVKLIISATIGFDHIDTSYCKDNGIQWTNCPGCNAPSVRQYIHSVLLLLKRERGFNLQEKTIGIVGAGHVGSLVAEDARALGMNVLVNDPIRQMNEPDGNFVNLNEIAEKCEISIKTKSLREIAESGNTNIPKCDQLGATENFIPKFIPDTGETTYEFLSRLAWEGLHRNYKVIPKEYEDRLKMELETIHKLGYVEYFLVVYDYINFARNNNIPVGPGRGSGAGSLVAYCTGITQVDPMKYDLFFDRFINPERVSMPDFDVDNPEF